MFYFKISILLSLLCIKYSESSGENGDVTINNVDENSNDSTNVTKEDANSHKMTRTPIELYKRLFHQHRKIQLDAVKSLQEYGDYSQRYKLVDMMIQQLFKVIVEAKVNLTEWRYLPGDPFPNNETVRDSLSKVLENTAMFGDMVLRLPDVVHKIFDKNREYQMLMKWSVGFCNETGVFEDGSATLLNLMAQEINLIPRNPDFVNPFTEENIRIQQKAAADKNKSQKKNNKKKDGKKRGPRMSNGGRVEL